MGGRHTLERNEKRVKPRDHFLGFVLVAIRREIYDVAEQQCNVIVAARNYRADIAESKNPRKWSLGLTRFSLRSSVWRPRDHFLGFVLVAIRREIYDVVLRQA